MLLIYDSLGEIPDTIKYVKDNDFYFDAKTKLVYSDLVVKVLEEIDKVQYVSEFTFLSRNVQLGSLNKNLLSTGSKTLLNIVSDSSVCFDVCECGVNVLDFCHIFQ